MRRIPIPFRETRAGRLRLRRPAAHVLLCLFLLAAVAGHTLYYFWAVDFVRRLDLHGRGDISGAVFYASPKRLFVGQPLSRDRLVEYLKEINFVEGGDAGQPGTYSLLGKDSLRVNSRLREFPSLAITFRRGRVQRLVSEAGAELAEAEVEPETLATFVRTIQGEDDVKRFLARRYVVAAEEIMNSELFPAVLAAEDDTFMSHRGVCFLHLLLAVFEHRGGSTITMQVIKNAVSLDASGSYWRKLNELYLATALERRMSKQEIFQIYANHTYMGSIPGGFALYGYAAAAEEYFGKRDLRALTLGEACTLAGMTHGPNRYLRKAREGDYGELTRRRDWVLKRLNKEWPERFTDEVVEAARREPVRFVFNSQRTPESQLDKVSSEFVEYARENPSSVLMNALPPTDYSGVHVYTSIDSDLMLAGQHVLAGRLAQIERQYPPVDESTGRRADDRLLGTVIALNPTTGEIITMVGGAGGRDGQQYSALAINALGAPASTIKPPFVALALDRARLPDGQLFTPASYVVPSEGHVSGWSPKIGVGRPCRARRCLSRSDDGFAAVILGALGLERGAEFYRSLTGVSPSPLTGKLAIGFGDHLEVSPLKQGLVYSMFANGGTEAEPRAVSTLYKNGIPLRLPASQSRPPSVSPGAAFITAEMLRSVLGWGEDGAAGTAARVPFARDYLRAHPEVEMGGKTGSGPHATWMISVGPNLVVVVWVGYQNHSQFARTGEVLASNTAALIWSDFMTQVNNRRPDLLRGKFRRPEGVREATVNPVRGCLAEHGLKEYFMAGAMPAPCESR